MNKAPVASVCILFSANWRMLGINVMLFLYHSLWPEHVKDAVTLFTCFLLKRCTYTLWIRVSGKGTRRNARSHSGAEKSLSIDLSGLFLFLNVPSTVPFLGAVWAVRCAVSPWISLLRSWSSSSTLLNLSSKPCCHECISDTNSYVLLVV